MLSAFTVFFTREDSSPCRLTLSKAYLSSMCASLPWRGAWNKSQLPVLTSFDNLWLLGCCSGAHVRCPWVSAQTYQMGRNMSNRSAPSCPGRTTEGCIASNLSCITKSPVHSALTSREEWCLVSLAGSEACGFRKPVSSMAGGDLAVLQGDAEVVGGLWAVLPLWTVRAGCAGLHGQPAPGRGCSSSVSTHLACSPGLEAAPWSCSLSLNCGYGPLKTDTKAQGKHSPTFAKCFEIFFCTRTERL